MDMVYFICAEAWGWTPEQVDKVDLETLNKLIFWHKRMEEEKAAMLKVAEAMKNG